MKNSFLVSRSKPDDTGEIFDLHCEHYGHKRSKYAWEWEYGSHNPNKSVLVVAKMDGNIIGTQGMMGIHLSIDGKLWLTGKSESTLINSKYRGNGVFTPLYSFALDECADEKMACVWGFTRKAIGPLMRVKFRIFKGCVKISVLSIKIFPTGAGIDFSKKTLLRKTLIKTGLIFSSVYSNLLLSFKALAKASPDPDFVFKNELNHPEDIIGFYSELRKQYPGMIHLHQDDRFIDWRIRNAPQKIERFYLYNKNRLAGYMYLTIKGKFMKLSDITFYNKKEGIILMDKLVDFINHKKIELVMYMGNRTNPLNIMQFRLLSSYGFIQTKGLNEFVLRNLNYPDETKISDIKNWYFNSMWSEGI